MLLVALATVVGAMFVAAPPEVAEAGVYFNSTQYTYKEYWASHSTFTAGCGTAAQPSNSWYIEPDATCSKTIQLAIPDNVGNAIAATIYVDLWKNRLTKSARFTINNSPQYIPNAGSNYSRTAFTATVPLAQLSTGNNAITFQANSGAYHVHDVMIRVYYDAGHPIVAGPGSDVTPPNGALATVSTPGGPTLDPAIGGTLQVDGNQVTLTASATDAKYVEFHAYYEGYDEDNDGVTRDWHNFVRNNWSPGGTEAKTTGATIGHIGTDSTAPYSVTWSLPDVVSQTGVKFKIRVVDVNGNVIEAPGGASADFTLQRSYSVETYQIPGFQDNGLHFDEELPQLASDTINLPDDLSGVTRAILLGNYWNSPDISLNDHTPFPAFVGTEDTWRTSQRDIDPTQLVPGANSIKWNYNPPGFGSMIESPGPMIVIHRNLPAGAPVITKQPKNAYATAGLSATFTAAATGAAPIQYTWLRDGTVIPGATSSTYTTPALSPGDSGATYSVRVQNGAGTATSAAATLFVTSPPASNSPWWNTQWSFRVPLTVGSDATGRANAVVEQFLNFSDLMAAAGSGGPTFDPNSIRVIEVDAVGAVLDAAVPFQFERGTNYNASTNAAGSLVWQMTGTTAPGTTRRYFAYFDKTSKAIPAVTFTRRITRTVTTDQGFPAYKFDLEDGSDWYFHYADGGGFSSIVDREGNDWIAWSTATGTAGNFRGFPNAIAPPGDNFHPGRAGKTTTTILSEGPLRITFETRSKDNAWIAIWYMYPTHSEFAMTRANSLYWVMYEGVPGGSLDAGDFIQRSDGVTVPSTGTFEVDLPGEEWMYAADPAKNRSFYMAHAQDDGSVESYKQLNNQMTVLGIGRGGNNNNFPYLRRLENNAPQRFAAGLADSIDAASTGSTIRQAYVAPSVLVGSSEFHGTAVVNGPFSDSFNGSSLNPMWTEVDPLNDTALVFNGSAVEIRVPAGVSHDLWTGRSNAPRLLQSADDADLDVVAHFDSSPTVAGQGQGLLFVQDAQNWIRFSILRTATRTEISVFKMVNGKASRIKNVNLAGTGLGYLRVIRTGDSWTFQRSWNGTTWLAHGTFTIPFDLTQVGVVATSHASGTSPGFTAVVDYFESKTSGLPVETGPTISNVSVAKTSRNAVVTWTTDSPSTTRLDFGATTALGKSSSNATLTTSHSVAISYLPCGAPYFVRPESTDASGTTTNSLVSFVTDACRTIASDDFSSGSQSPFWTVFDPVGDAVVNYSSTNALVSIPAGVKHDLYPGANLATRIRQEGPVGDFGVEAKFESTLDKRYQMQGIVVEEDENSYLRFEIHQDTNGGTNTKAYVAAVLDDVVTTPYYGNLPQAAAHYMRVTRVGNQWTMAHSTDNLAWTNLVTFTASVQSAYVGPYIGTTSTGSATSPSFVGSIDYFFNVANPLVDDGSSGPDLTPPVISAAAAAVGTPVGGATVSWTTNEPAKSKVDWGLTTAYTGGSITSDLAVVQHSLVIPTLSCGATYFYRITSTDTSNNAATLSAQSFTTPTCPSGAFSDNFDTGSLDSRWIVRNPAGDGVITPLNGLVSMNVPGAVRHDLSTANNSALRMTQPVPNGDFEVQVGFESVANFGYQLQGIVFEQTDTTLLRFDIFNDGSQTKVFVGYLKPASLQTLATAVVPGAVPGTLRTTRTGSTWLFQYSADDGASWQTIYSGTIAVTVNRIGPFVGNAPLPQGTAPEHTALVDYFWSSSDPITITKPGMVLAPEFQIFGGNGEVWDGQPLRFGDVGMAQPGINVQGRVTDADGINSLTYGVNGGEPVRMGIGTKDCSVGVSCTRRLAGYGDFNADIDRSRLVAGLNTITFRAIDGAFNVSSIDVPVTYTPGNSWPIPYSIDWSSVTDLNRVIQPVDGRFVVEGDTVRTKEIGYDRLLAIGDETWRSYEIEVPITVNSVDFAGYEAPSGGPAVGFIAHWQGHYQEGIVQPMYGFRDRLGALAWYHWRKQPLSQRLEILNSQASPMIQDLSGKTLTPGVTYIYKMQVEEATTTQGPTYRLKVWQQGTTEPVAWDLVTTAPLGTLTNGGALLVAHHVDASFGDVSVRPLSAGAPSISPTSGSYTGSAQVSMTTSQPGSQIRFTLDGSDPTASSPLYSAPFAINQTTIVKARTFKTGVSPSAVTVRTYTILPASSGRVTAGLEAEYLFDEGSGSTIHDSAAGAPLDLTVQSGSSVRWLPGALRLEGSSLLRTALGAKLVNEPIQTSQALSVEMWIDPSTVDSATRTILDIGPFGSTDQNLELTQLGTAMRSALRSSTTSKAGLPYQTTTNAVQDGLHQMVYVRRPNGVVEVFVDGASIWTSTVTGTFNNWVLGYPLGIGNNNDRTEPWLGDLYHVAIYSDDLTVGQVAQNYAVGVLAVPNNAAPTVNAGPDQSVPSGATVTLAATATDDGRPAPPASISTSWRQVSGPGSSSFANSSDATTTVTMPVSGTYVLEWSADDGQFTSTDTVQIVVQAAAPLVAAPLVVAPLVAAPPLARVQDGLLALYGFDEATGATVVDQSADDLDLDLSILNPPATTRVPGGLRLDEPTQIVSSPSAPLAAALASTGEVTTEFWLEAVAADDVGAFVFGISSDVHDLTVLQTGLGLDAYVRTTALDALEAAPLSIAMEPGLRHVVLTRTAGGVITMYMDGAPLSVGTSADDFSGWTSDAALHLGGDLDGSLPWRGTLYTVALYDRALSAEEVLQNFAVGEV